MYFLMGFAGALTFFVLVSIGFVCGWQARKHYLTSSAESLTPEQKRRQQEEHDALQALHNYSFEDAYNLSKREGGSP